MELNFVIYVCVIVALNYSNTSRCARFGRRVNNLSCESQRRTLQNSFDAKLPTHPLNAMLSADAASGEANPSGIWTPTTRSLPCAASEGSQTQPTGYSYMLLTKRRTTTLRQIAGSAKSVWE